MSGSPSVAGILTRIISAHIVSSNFEMEQTVGDFLGNFMQLMYNDTLLRGFSHYSAEACHEFYHGINTCDRWRARDFECKGRLVLI